LAFSTGIVSMSASMSLVCTYATFASVRALKLVKNPVVSNRSKHIDVVYHSARERVARKDAEIAYVKTNDMLADMLTKPVEKAKLDLCNRGTGYGLKPNTGRNICSTAQCRCAQPVLSGVASRRPAS